MALVHYTATWTPADRAEPEAITCAGRRESALPQRPRPWASHGTVRGAAEAKGLGRMDL